MRPDSVEMPPKVLVEPADPILKLMQLNAISTGKLVFKGEADSKSLKWILATLLAEHSTLDWITVEYADLTQNDVISHIVRHTRHNPRFIVQSQRPDWTGKERPREASARRMFISRWPLRALQAMMRERLCGKAMLETRTWAEEFKESLLEQETLFTEALALTLVPMCVYRNGCPYSKSCGLWDKYLGGISRDSLTIAERYYFYRRLENERG